MNLGKEPFYFFREENNIMDQFWTMLRESTIFQGFITLCFVGTTCYLWAAGKPVPQELWTANTIVLGFFFGSKTQQFASARR